jgi:hypothetical protein
MTATVAIVLREAAGLLKPDGRMIASGAASPIS